MKRALLRNVRKLTTMLLAALLAFGCLSIPAEAAKPLKNTRDALSVGDTICFGSFEQDGNTRNGKEQLWWRVLEVDDGYALIITEEGIDSRPYHAKGGSTNWTKCSLRTWLNGEFYRGIRNGGDYEIAQAEVETCDNPYAQNPSCVTTRDKIFLLSSYEAELYFDGDSDRLCYASDYAAKQGAYVSPSTGGSWWLLRDGGDSTAKVASVNSDGSIDYDGGRTESLKGIVRPAMWICFEP